jgi:hypothetical protein
MEAVGLAKARREAGSQHEMAGEEGFYAVHLGVLSMLRKRVHRSFCGALARSF